MAPTNGPVFAANWKMNHTPAEGGAFVDAFAKSYSARDDRTVILIPSALAFASVQQACAPREDIRLGVQNVHAEEKGAFTGENSARIAAAAGARFVLVGHSERRHVFGETDAETARKCARVHEHGMTPILCVGEKLEEREAGTTKVVVLRQLSAGLAGLSAEAVGSTLIAYEPVWAIGTGRTATPEDAAEVHRAIRSELARNDIPVLYGGSVTRDNVAALLAADEVGGVLVGGASLDAANWAAICSAPLS